MWYLVKKLILTVRYLHSLTGMLPNGKVYLILLCDLPHVVLVKAIKYPNIMNSICMIITRPLTKASSFANSNVPSFVGWNAPVTSILFEGTVKSDCPFV